MRCLIGLTCLAGLMLGQHAIAQQSKTVFEDRFDGALKPQWSAIRPTISTTPAGGHRYLGPFAGESAVLSLADLPDHRLVRLSMDVLIMRSYDGNAPQQGPDIFYIYSDDGRVLYATSFSWYVPQAYPGFFGIHTAPLATGVEARNTFGFIHLGEPRDGKFHVEIVFPHRQTKLGFRFLATTQSAITDEAWGLLNVKVSLEDAPAPAATSLEQAWRTLEANVPLESTQAFWKIVSAGDLAVPMLAEKLRGKTLPPDVELLDPTRAMTRRTAPAGTDGFSISDASQRQLILTAHALQVIGTDAAKEARKSIKIAPPEKVKTVVVNVRDNTTREPLPFIPIWIWTYNQANHASVVTDAAGKATVDIPAELTGQFYFLTPRAGYVPVGKVIRGTELPASLDLPMEKSVVIGGTILDHQQKPLANAPLAFSMRKQFNEPSLITRLDGLNVVTDNDGHWSMDLGPAKPDTLLIGVRDPLAPPNDPIATIDYLPKLAELREQKLVMSLPKPTMLRGKVVDAETAKPVAKFRISLATVDAQGLLGAWTPITKDWADGTFDVPVSARFDRVALKIDAEGYLTTTTELIERSAMEKEQAIKMFSQR